MLTDMLPEGLVVSGGVAGLRAHRTYPLAAKPKKRPTGAVPCPSSGTVSCSTALDIPAFEGLEILIPVEVARSAGDGGESCQPVVRQGGVGAEEGGMPVARASLTRAVHVSGTGRVRCRRRRVCAQPGKDGGSVDTQAGSHPFQLTATVNFNQTLEKTPVAEGEPAVKGLQPAGPALAKDLGFSLPPGLLGAVPRCNSARKLISPRSGSRTSTSARPARPSAWRRDDQRSQAVRLSPVRGAAVQPRAGPGEPARFGFETEKVPVRSTPPSAPAATTASPSASTKQPSPARSSAARSPSGATPATPATTPPAAGPACSAARTHTRRNLRSPSTRTANRRS